jgi:hypothetical protein
VKLLDFIAGRLGYVPRERLEKYKAKTQRAAALYNGARLDLEAVYLDLGREILAKRRLERTLSEINAKAALGSARRDGAVTYCPTDRSLSGTYRLKPPAFPL